LVETAREGGFTLRFVGGISGWKSEDKGAGLPENAEGTNGEREPAAQGRCAVPTQRAPPTLHLLFV